MYFVKGLSYTRLTKIRNGIRKKRVSQSFNLEVVIKRYHWWNMLMRLEKRFEQIEAVIRKYQRKNMFSWTRIYNEHTWVVFKCTWHRKYIMILGSFLSCNSRVIIKVRPILAAQETLTDFHGDEAKKIIRWAIEHNGMGWHGRNESQQSSNTMKAYANGSISCQYCFDTTYFWALEVFKNQSF